MPRNMGLNLAAIKREVQMHVTWDTFDVKFTSIETMQIFTLYVT